MDVLSKVEEYLKSKLIDPSITFDTMPQPTEIPNIDKAYDRFIQALANSEKIFYVHDSDADGVGSAAVAYRFMRDLGYPEDKVFHRITKRNEGYGFIPEHIQEAKDFGATLIITTDNGITSFDACKLAKEHSIDVIITDHHQVEKNMLPDAIIVNPQIIKHDSYLKDLSGTAVFWYFIKYVTERSSSIMIDPFKYIEEVTLTTISDMMPLQHINRLFVKEGLRYYNNDIRKPFAKIVKEMSKYDPDIKAESIAFSLAPLINAANRLDQADIAYKFLIAQSDQIAKMHYHYLANLNDQRKDLTQLYIDTVSKHPIVYEHLVFVIVNNVKKGILGLLANKLAQDLNKPAIVVTTTEEGIVEGSGRSVGRIDMLDVLKKSGLCDAGGHKQAFGITIEKQNIGDLIKFVNEYLKTLPKSAKSEPDGSFMDLTFDQITQELYELIDSYEPFGIGYPKPLFGANVTIRKAYRFGKQNNHTKLFLQDEIGNEIEMVNFFDTSIYSVGQRIRINYTIEYDNYLKRPTGRIKKIIQGVV